MKRAAPSAWLPVITDREFQLLQALILREAGVFLGEHKRALMVGRLSRRLRALELESFGDYYDHVVAQRDDELTNLIDAILTNETRFFREPEHFSFVQDRVVPELVALAAAGRKEKRLRVWSAACSTGEEPYSLAMLLLASLPPEAGWELEIVATDLSTRVLARAQEAVWPIEKAAEIPYEYVKQFMLRGTGSQVGKMRASAALRSVVHLSRMNLSADSYPVEGTFNLVFCRNVLIYFDAPGKAKVVARLLSRLQPHGYFFLGHAETLAGLSEEMQSVVPNVYRKKPSLRSFGADSNGEREGDVDAA